MDRNMKKKKISFEIILVVLILVLHAYVAFSPSAKMLNWFRTDDAFYYFTIARNIAEGKGVTFDGISATNGFHPLWMLICIPIFSLASTDLFLPLRILIMLMAVLNACTGILLYRFFSKKFSKESGWFVAIFWAFMPRIHLVTSKLGLETGLTAFLFVAVVVYLASFDERELSPKNILVMSLLSTLLLLSRLDTIFFVMLFGIWLVFRRSTLRWQILLDGLITFLSVMLAYYLRVQNTDNIFNFLPFLYLFLLLSLFSKVIAQYFLSGYIVDDKVSLRKQLIRVGLAMVISVVVTGGVLYLLHDVLKVFLGFPRAVLLIEAVISTFCFTAWRVFYMLYMRYKKRSYTEDISLKGNWKHWTANILCYFGPILAVLVAYLLINHSYTEVYMPISGTIKRWWGTLPFTFYGRPLTKLSEVLGSWFNTSTQNGPWWVITDPVNLINEAVARATRINPESTSFLNFKRDFGGLVWVLVLGLLFWITYKKKGFIQKAMRETAFFPLFVGCVFHFFSYSATGYLHAKFWYWVPQMLCALIGLGILMESVLRRYKKFLYGNTASQLIVLVLSIVLVVNFTIPLIKNYTYTAVDPEDHPYLQETRFLEEYTQPGEKIGMTGGGVNAYFIEDRAILNLDGLVNGYEYFSLLQTGDAYQYLDEVGLDHVYGLNEMLINSDPYGWTFKGRLELIADYYGMSLYHYQTGIEPEDILPEN